MIKTIFAFGALTLVAAAPAAAQMAAPAGGALPKCSATVRDSCDQSMTTERNAMTADQAMKTGGVGDRKSGGMAMAADRPMAGKPMMHHKRMMHHKHKMMKTTTTTTNETKPM